MTQNNETVNNNPALMTVIINIQSMSKFISKEIPFEYLEKKTSIELYTIQDNLIPRYNKAIAYSIAIG